MYNLCACNINQEAEVLTCQDATHLSGTKISTEQ